MVLHYFHYRPFQVHRVGACLMLYPIEEEEALSHLGKTLVETKRRTSNVACYYLSPLFHLAPSNHFPRHLYTNNHRKNLVRNLFGGSTRWSSLVRIVRCGSKATTFVNGWCQCVACQGAGRCSKGGNSIERLRLMHTLDGLVLILTSVLGLEEGKGTIWSSRFG